MWPSHALRSIHPVETWDLPQMNTLNSYFNQLPKQIPIWECYFWFTIWNFWKDSWKKHFMWKEDIKKLFLNHNLHGLKKKHTVYEGRKYSLLKSFLEFFPFFLHVICFLYTGDYHRNISYLQSHIQRVFAIVYQKDGEVRHRDFRFENKAENNINAVRNRT